MPDSGAPPLQVNFAATATPSNCSGEVAYAWDFGDGHGSAQQNPGHTFSAPGSYVWTLTVTAEGATCSKTGTVTVSSGCTLTCSASAAPASGAPPLAVTFASSAEPTNCSGTVAYSWNFGDGATSTEQNPTHIYASAGSYGWTFTATAGGATCTRTGTVTASATGVPGDANGDGVVSIGEVQQAINMFLGTQGPGNGVDCSGDGVVSIGEVQKVINAFLGLPSSC